MEEKRTRAEVIAETKQSQEIASTFRVYLKEWLYGGRFPTEPEAQLEATNWEGRLYPGDLEVRRDGDSWVVMKRLWNVIAEWKHEAAAKHWAEKFDGAQVVTRNSRAEHLLKNYGMVRLPT